MGIKNVSLFLSIGFVLILGILPLYASAACDPVAASGIGPFNGCEMDSFDFQSECGAIGGESVITDARFSTLGNYGYMCYGDPVVTMECTCPAVTYPVPTLTFTADSTDVFWGGETTLRWSSTDATSCTASSDWSGDQPTAGSVSTGSIWSDKTYALGCTGPGGSVLKYVNVTWHVVPTTQEPTTNTPPSTSDAVPVGNLDSATCSAVSGWTYDPDTTPTLTPGTDYCPNIDGTQSSLPDGYTFDSSGNCVVITSSTACWQTPSAQIIDGYTRCQQSGPCGAGGVADSKCLDDMGNMEQPPGRDYCIAVSSLDDADCNRPVPYTPPTTTTLSCTIAVNEPAVPLGISTHQGEGSRVLGNQSSADFACRQLGYDSAAYFQTRGWSSCGDNQFAYDGGGFWAYGDACALGNSGISYVQCRATGAICQNRCGNSVLDPGEQCDGNSATRFNRCGEPSWYCSNSCTIISNSIDSRVSCP